jgi:hypothetical protein
MPPSKILGSPRHCVVWRTATLGCRAYPHGAPVVVPPSGRWTVNKVRRLTHHPQKQPDHPAPATPSQGPSGKAGQSGCFPTRHGEEKT